MPSNTAPVSPAASLSARSLELSTLLDALLRLAPQTYQAVREGHLADLEALVQEQEALIERFHALLGLDPQPATHAIDAPTGTAPTGKTDGEESPDLGALAQRLAESNGRIAALVFACLKVMSAEAAYVERISAAPPLYERFGPRQQPESAQGRRINSQV